MEPLPTSISFDVANGTSACRMLVSVGQMGGGKCPSFQVTAFVHRDTPIDDGSEREGHLLDGFDKGSLT